MSIEEKLARRLLMDEGEKLCFDVELKDMRERDLVAHYMSKWGCEVVLEETRPRLHVTITPECLSSMGG